MSTSPKLPKRTLTGFVLLGALLLFGVEPLVGKLLLPAYGGSFHVWTTCLNVFQGALLVGYLYCHLLAPRLGRWHMLVVLAPLPFLPLSLSALSDTGYPVLSVVGTLALGVGVPFAVLATTSVVAQCWWVGAARDPASENPYPLYAASNLGSLVALLAYPFLVEPLVGLQAQRYGWSVGFVVYVALAGLAAWRSGARRPVEVVATAEPQPIAPTTYLYWFLLSAIPSAFLLATTNVVTLDVGSFPFLWVLPLAVYLTTFVLTFREVPWCPGVVRRFWLEFSLVGVFFWTSGFLEISGWKSLVGSVAHTCVLFVVCLIAHRTLYMARPAAAQLTRYYLVISLGGWVGGLCVTFLAPALFSSLLEYPLAIVALALTLLVYRWEEFRAWLRTERKPLLAGSAFLLLFIPVWLAASRGPAPDFVLRNAYGLYRVITVEPEDGGEPTRTLVHGVTLHGSQLLDHPARATAYYGESSPVLDALQAFPRPREVAVVGLGVGTLAAHFVAGERLTFFELDPDNETIAREHFSYLSDCAAEPTVVAGDARLRIAEQATEGQYDVLVVDAFSGDSVPAHLLTHEALQLYLSKLRPDGLLAIHVSNRYVDLRPVLQATGAPLGVTAYYRASQPSNAWETVSQWVAFSRSDTALAGLGKRGWRPVAELGLPSASPWTDDHASLLSAFWAGIWR